MNENPSCELCSGQMTKTDSLNSGNARYITYSCKNCSTQKTQCVSVGDNI